MKNSEFEIFLLAELGRRFDQTGGQDLGVGLCRTRSHNELCNFGELGGVLVQQRLTVIREFEGSFDGLKAERRSEVEALEAEYTEALEDGVPVSEGTRDLALDLIVNRPEIPAPTESYFNGRGFAVFQWDDAEGNSAYLKVSMEDDLAYFVRSFSENGQKCHSKNALSRVRVVTWPLTVITGLFEHFAVENEF